MSLEQFLAALLGSLPMTGVVAWSLGRLVRQLDELSARLREVELKMAGLRARSRRERIDDDIGDSGA